MDSLVDEDYFTSLKLAKLMKSQQNTVLKEGPVNWELIRLKDVIVEIINGFACGRRDDDGIVQIRMNNVTVDGRLIFDKFLRVPIPNSIDIMLLRQGDFLFNNTNSIDLVGKSTVFNEAPFPCTFSNHFTRIRLKTDQIIPEFLLYNFLILWEKNYFRSLAIRHVGQAAVHKKYLMKLKLRLPPVPEQKKSAEILTTLDEAIEKVDGAIQKAERLKKGLMQTLLSRGMGHKEFKETKIGMIPQKWGVERIIDLFEVKTGSTPSTKINKYWEDGTINWYTPADMNKLNGRLEINKSKRKITSEGLSRSNLNLVPSNSIIISTRAPVGYVVIPTEKATFNQGCKGLVPKTKTETNQKYYAYYLQSKKNNLENRSSGSTFKELGKFILENFKIPLPPLPEQKKIAEILSSADQKLELMRERKCKLNRVKKGLMHDLLTGRKRVRLDG